MPPKDYDEYEGSTLKLSEEAYKKMFEACSRNINMFSDLSEEMKDAVNRSRDYLEELMQRQVKEKMEKKPEHVWPGMEDE